MKTALVLNAINPTIGGVLIRGQRGTAKSTAVRALAHLLPELEVIAGCRFGCDPGSPANWCDDCRASAAAGRSRSSSAAGSGSSSCRSTAPRTGWSGRSTPRRRSARRAPVRAGAARRRESRHPLRRRDQPARRSHRRRAARCGRDGVERRRARGHLVRPPLAVHPRRHDESRGGRAPAAAARPVRALRRHHRAARHRRAGAHHRTRGRLKPDGHVSSTRSSRGARTTSAS